MRHLFKLMTAACLLATSAGAYAEDVVVYAAASLTSVIDELSSDYQKSHPAVKIKKSYAASSTLAKQIENGAPATLFLSADLDWANYLSKRGQLVSASRKNLLGNELVLITPKERPITISFEPSFNLAGSFSGRWCTGEPTSVPAGKYAKQALSYYKWWSAMEPRLVGTEDVRTALAFVERGECALGVVYKTDALISQKVSLVATFPAASHKPVVYPGALVKGAGSESQAFWQYLQGDEAKTVFGRYGFNTVP
jgi:molybdate transport system substrate-binding protein